MKKLAALTIETEKCDVESDKIKSISKNKIATLFKNLKNYNLLLL